MFALVMKEFLAGLLLFARIGRGKRRANRSAARGKQLAPMPTARQELATAVLNGKIYVIGGLNADGISTDTSRFTTQRRTAGLQRSRFRAQLITTTRPRRRENFIL